MTSHGISAALVLAAALLLSTSCQQGGSSALLRTPPAVQFRPVATPIHPRSVRQMSKEIGILVRYMPKNTRPRQASHRLRPTFITIHSTSNHNYTATAMQHNKALCRGVFSNKSWHFTVDQFMAVQNLPLNETGWHAGNAAGNNNSIGIEMCETENKGQNHFRTWDRAAKLTALLMTRYHIDQRHVVPHYHWTHKNCPTPLLTNGRPGPKWAWFHSRVDYYYRCLNNGRSAL